MAQESSRTAQVFEATIPELQLAMSTGAATSVDLVKSYLERIAAYDRSGPQLNSIIRLNPKALEEAAQLDGERSAGTVRGPLHGIPILLKDNYDTRDLPTSGGSVALAGWIPPDDAFQVKRLRQAGVVILGKTNMHELAAGITSVSSLGGQTRNPYAPSRNAGGSSGGTGAAIAASFAAVGMGSDTCGSIRIPSAHNNLVGLRPTRGLSSIDGIIPLSHTQDTAGPLARRVVDLAIVLDSTIGPDPSDPATQVLEDRRLPAFVESLNKKALQGARIGVVRNLFGDLPEDEEVAEVVEKAIQEMEELGAVSVDITIPDFEEMVNSATSVISFEFKFDLIDYLTRTPGAPVHSLEAILEKGLHHLALEDSFRRRNALESRDSEDYQKALARRKVIRDSTVRLLDQHLLDALVYPTIRRKAAHVGDRQFGSNCRLSAHSGLPALSIPAGFTMDGLPVGIELLGRPFEDARLLALGYAFEQSVDHRRAPDRTPPLSESSAVQGVQLQVIGEDKDPGISLEATLRYDQVRNELGFDLGLTGIDPGKVYTLTLHLAKENETGPAVERIMGPGTIRRSGLVILTKAMRDALRQGQLYLVLYTRDHPMGALRRNLELR